MRMLFILSLFISHEVIATIVGPELSDRSYRYIELDNSLKVLLIADPTTSRAAASLDVFVGSNNDPAEFPGLAHLLEHMLFLGTDQFPEPGEYQQFLASRDGVYNASTAPEHTNYFFGVAPEAFEDALDRFSRFFIAPNLNPTHVEREINAVHAEYQSKLKNEGRRAFEATKKGLNPRHPLTRFSAGNLDSLKKEGLNRALKKFYTSQYSSNRMALAVIADRTLDELENIIRDRFSQIKNRDLDEAYVSEPLFDLTRLPYVVESKPVSESRMLTLMWPMPNTDAFVSKAPLEYISHLLGHEGETSLLTRFKKLGWAVSLRAGDSIAMTDNQSMSISISLTPDGYKNRHQVIADILSAIKRIESDGLAKWRFDELRTVREAYFQYAEESGPVSTVTNLAGRLHTVPTSDIFTHGALLSSFDEQIIRDILTWFTPDRMLVLLRAPEVDANETTAHYPTEIRQYKLDPRRLADFISARATPLADIEWPAPNPFVTDPSQPLKVIRKTTSDTQPRLVISTPGIWGYVLSENRFSQPRSDLYVLLRTPLATDSPESTVMAALLATAINEEFNTLSYNAALAGASFTARATQTGITLKFSGFHQALLPLIDAIVENIRIPLIDQPTWTRLYQAKQQHLSGVDSKRPFTRLYDEMTAGLMPFAFTQAELKEVFPSITRAVFHQYQKAFFAGLQFELFLHGPVSIDDGRNLLTSITNHLPIDADSNTIEMTTRPWTQNHSKEYSFPHPDQAAVVAYVSDDNSPEGRILNQFAGNLLEAPFFNTLRTDKQLGYLTFATAFTLFNTPILSGVIQSPVASPDALVEAITQFMSTFPNEVELLTDEKYNITKRMMVDALLNPPLTQNEMSNAIWQAIALRRPFNDRMVQAAILNRLSKKDFVKYLRTRLQNPIILKAYNNK